VELKNMAPYAIYFKKTIISLYFMNMSIYYLDPLHYG